MSKRHHIPAIPCIGLSEFNSENFEWEDEPLTEKEVREMRDRLARAAREMHADDLRRIAAVAAMIEEDRVWLAEYERRVKERAELIAAVVSLYRRDRASVPKGEPGVARRAVSKLLGDS